MEEKHWIALSQGHLGYAYILSIVTPGDHYQSCYLRKGVV